MKRARLSVALILLVGSALDAQAYVRTRSSYNKPGIPSYWPGGCVFIRPDALDADEEAAVGLPPATVYAVVQRALANWNDRTAKCAYLKLTYDDPVESEAHYDGTNVIKFRTDQWCHPEDAQDHGMCYSAQAAAITSVFLINHGEDEDGLILDADIELNTLNFKFVDGPTGVSLDDSGVADLENTLTHEIGHLLGLSHTCRDPAWFENDVDEQGNPPPDCSTVNDLPIAERLRITTATMYNFAQPGETAKRSPEADDVAGVCNAYPAGPAKDSLDRPDKDRCAHTDLARYVQPSGCDVNPHALPASVPFVLLIVAGSIWRARSRQGR